MLCGAKGEDKKADAEAQSILDEVREHIVAELGAEPTELTAVTYATQIVQGTNYFIKAHIGNKKFIHVRIYKTLPCYGGEVALHGIQKDKSEQESIAYF